MLKFCEYFVLRPLLRIDRWLFLTGLVSHYVPWEGLVLAVFDAFLVALVGAVSGWTVGRAHRACSGSVSFAFAFSVGVYMTVALAWLAYAPFKFVYWPNVLLTVLVAPSSVLFGGLLSTQRRVKASM
jgi:hypothetical protein